MKPERALIAERPAAQHCCELLRSAPPPIDLLPHCARLGERLARLLPGGLAAFSFGIPPFVTCTSPRELAASELAAEVAPLAANILFAIGEAPLLVSIEAGAVFRLLDRVFGGRGTAPDPLPDAFPTSAELLVTRIETLLAATLGQAAGAHVRQLRSDSSLCALAPFAPAMRLAVMTIEIAEEGGGEPWRIVLALPLATLDALFGRPGRPATARTADPAAAPFGEVPLPLTAVLVEMNVPMATISALEPGMTLPVAVARKVPLRVGQTTVAHGTVGALDDCAALQITQLA